MIYNWSLLAGWLPPSPYPSPAHSPSDSLSHSLLPCSIFAAAIQIYGLLIYKVVCTLKRNGFTASGGLPEQQRAATAAGQLSNFPASSHGHNCNLYFYFSRYIQIIQYIICLKTICLVTPKLLDWYPWMICSERKKKHQQMQNLAISLTYYEIGCGRPAATIILGSHGPGPACPVHNWLQHQPWTSWGSHRFPRLLRPLIWLCASLSLFNLMLSPI